MLEVGVFAGWVAAFLIGWWVGSWIMRRVVAPWRERRRVRRGKERAVRQRVEFAIGGEAQALVAQFVIQTVIHTRTVCEGDAAVFGDGGESAAIVRELYARTAGNRRVASFPASGADSKQLIEATLRWSAERMLAAGLVDPGAVEMESR